MTQHLSQLTSAELDKTIAAAEWLVSVAGDGLLDRQTHARISTLGANCRAEEEDRAAAAKRSREQAKAALAEAQGTTANGQGLSRVSTTGDAPLDRACPCGFTAQDLTGSYGHTGECPGHDCTDIRYEAARR